MSSRRLTSTVGHQLVEGLEDDIPLSCLLKAQRRPQDVGVRAVSCLALFPFLSRIGGLASFAPPKANTAFKSSTRSVITRTRGSHEVWHWNHHIPSHIPPPQSSLRFDIHSEFANSLCRTQLLRLAINFAILGPLVCGT